MPSTAPCWCWRRRICAPLNMCSPCIFLIRWWRPSYAMTKAPALPPSASCAAAFSIFSAITSSFSPAFVFVLEKGSKSAGNAVIPTFPMHRSHGLQHLRHKRLTFASADKSGYTLGFRRKIAHSGSHGEIGVFRTGVVSLPSERSTRFENSAWPGLKTANFALFGSRSRVLPKNAKSLRDSDALMRVAVPRRRGPAGLRDLFRFCRNCGLYALRSGPFRVCEAGEYHYPRRALCAVETLGARLAKWLICCFLRSGSHY